MKRLLATATLFLAAALPAAAADTYAIDRTHTFASYEISHLGFSTSRGRFDSSDGSIVLDLAKKTAEVSVTIDVNSINTGVVKLDEHLKSPDFFDAAKYPTITFKSTEARFKGDKLTALTGDLTLHGVTKPVNLKVKSFACKEHPMKKVPACGADAVATLKRSDWGITTYVPAVGDEVKLSIQVEAQLQPK